MNNAEMAQLTAWHDQEDRHVSLTIRKHGCFVQSVLGEATRPPFAYTVGLFGMGHPELIIFGLDHESACHTLNWFFERIRGGTNLSPGEIVKPADEAPRFLVETFPDPADFLFAANRHYRRSDDASVPAYQLTWDVDGKFSWDPGYPYPDWLQPRPGEAQA
ncbi:DUF4262 domain-containing protein [Spelaeicoccus albus]|nr:DUF4262 domain-containing protein [Spelaeicoccus albus]